jgi:hypothetical protein
VTLLQLLIGGLLLVLGRKLFWLFVAALGFVVALRLTSNLFVHQPGWIALAGALLAGVIGALLAIFLQRLAIAVAGFLAGAYLTMAVLPVFLPHLEHSGWLVAVIGGILGAVLLSAVFDWALIVLSSLSGASLIAQSLHLRSAGATLVFLVAAVLGIIIQAGMKRGERPTGR